MVDVFRIKTLQIMTREMGIVPTFSSFTPSGAISDSSIGERSNLEIRIQVFYMIPSLRLVMKSWSVKVSEMLFYVQFNCFPGLFTGMLLNLVKFPSYLIIKKCFHFPERRESNKVNRLVNCKWLMDNSIM